MNSQQKQEKPSDLPSQVTDSSAPLSSASLAGDSSSSANASSASVSTTHSKVPEQASSEQQASENPVKPVIQFDDFAKIDLKIGTIKAAEKVAKADKLLKLQIDLGFEERTIVSGIALHFKPDELVGKQVVVVANLAPRKMRGIESNGMILLAQNQEGKLIFVSPEHITESGAGVS